MAVAILARVSGEEQAEHGTVQTQIEFGKNYCKLYSLDLFGIYADEAVSGTTPLDSRPEGNRLLQDAHSQRFDTVLVYRLDRLGRDPRLILNVVNDFEQMGVRVVSMTESFDTSTPTGKLMLTMLAGFAGYERDSILERTREGSLRVAREGRWVGGYAPFGYRLRHGETQVWLEINDEPVPGVSLSEAQLVRWVFNHLAYEAGSTNSAARRLNDLRVPPRYTSQGRTRNRNDRGPLLHAWSVPSVYHMLKSTTYKGTHKYNKTGKSEVIERPCPPLVDDATWQLAQDRMQANNRFSKRNSKREYLLSGLVRCAHCGCTYVGQVNQRENRYYKCNTRVKQHSAVSEQQRRCDSKAIPALAVEASIWEDVEHFCKNPGDVLRQIATQQQERQDDKLGLQCQRDAIARTLAAKTEERDLVIGLYKTKRITLQKLDEQMSTIDAEENALRDQLDALDQQARGIDHLQAQLDDVSRMLKTLGDSVDNADFATKQRLVRTLVREANVYTITAEDGTKRAEVDVVFKFEVIGCSGMKGTLSNHTLTLTRRLAA